MSNAAGADPASRGSENTTPAGPDRGLIACPACDALLNEPGALANGARASCPRCGHVLETGEARGLDRVLAASIATVVLIVAALGLPFVSIEAAGRRVSAAVIDAAAAAGGDAWPLAVAVGALIFAIPLFRALALVYTLAPLRVGRPAAPGARAVFRLALELRPWSMVEVFLIGVAVALVKVADLAAIDIGAAFWLFAAVAILAFFEDAALRPRSVWRMMA